MKMSSSFKKITLLIVLTLSIVFIILTVYSTYTINKVPRIHYISWLPGKMLATTVPPIGIFIRLQYRNEGDSWGSILAHERAHWTQYQNLGLWGFYKNYYSGFIQYGRFDAPMEIEARQKSRN